MDQFPSFDLTNQISLVTGAARGLGRAISLAFAHAGAHVALGLRDINADAGLLAEIESLGRRALPLQMDMANIDQVQRAVHDVAAQFGRLDILVNNAGIAPGNLAADVSVADYDLTMAVGAGAFFASQAARRLMIEQKYGRIINLSSQAGFVALPTESVYCMAKAALPTTKCLAVEWGAQRHGERPRTDLYQTPGTAECLSDPVFRADVVERIAALHRIGEPMDVAGAVVFLASRAASLITGQTLMIDGGWTAR
jgi:NAD(P)-dependent dehydrogenase (short-subunit alcohol dehydrogenase family)